MKAWDDMIVPGLVISAIVGAVHSDDSIWSPGGESNS